MEMNEFLSNPAETEEEAQPEDIDVQKAVVESLAADKAEQDELIASLRKQVNELQSVRASLSEKLAQAKSKLAEVGDLLAKNSETRESNKVALLDRNVELDDRFLGETRDHVLEVLREARNEAEKNGRLRLGQVLEGVLLANESQGELSTRRTKLERLFSENSNIVSGPVIEELTKMGISYKNGEDYLLPSEIIARNY